MFFKNSLFLLCTVFVFCESSFVDNLGKCKINDGECEKDLIQSVIRDIAKTGVPELGIPTIDPIAINNISLAILNVIDITMIEGTAKGVKDCIVNKFVTKIEEGRAFMELTCDISIKGHYKVFSNSPLVKTLAGGDTVTGDGNGKVKIDKLYLKIDFDFDVHKKNGDLYIRCKNDKLKYTYEIKGKMTFFADSLYIGKQEASKLVTGVLNENWQMLFASFGTPFMDKAMDILYSFLHKFFDTVPAKHYILDDLSAYAHE
ncbi:uncharacterized protein LOC110377497 [Helicoverpa armigera]|uniref:uncharacterized protein LOC110377497 n=1 Tax=Helicoverpa armigera TaxID=29058 RepID=UPI001F5AD289|nr:uncharacterized protein LOC110377497 [Helicoverpa armigera]XP_047025455.1 uncharacterized protein LOC124634084 [Helicoverpa zea]